MAKRDWLRAEMDKLYSKEQHYWEELTFGRVTEMILRLMEEKKVSKAELARKIGKSRAYTTQLLNGRRNLTLKTICDILYYLGERLEISSRPIDDRDAEKKNNQDTIKGSLVSARNWQINYSPEMFDVASNEQGETKVA